MELKGNRSAQASPLVPSLHLTRVVPETFIPDHRAEAEHVVGVDTVGVEPLLGCRHTLVIQRHALDVLVGEGVVHRRVKVNRQYDAAGEDISRAALEQDALLVDQDAHRPGVAGHRRSRRVDHQIDAAGDLGVVDFVAPLIYVGFKGQTISGLRAGALSIRPWVPSGGLSNSKV